MRALRIPELVISAEPKPSEVQYLEDRIYEFNASATGITDGEWLGIFVRDEDHRIVAGICVCVSTLVRQPFQHNPHEWDTSPIEIAGTRGQLTLRRE